MNAITSSGKIVVSTFKANPNRSFDLPLVNNNIPTITDEDLLNNMGYTITRAT